MEKSLTHLIEHHEFYANLLYQMRIEFTTKVDRAGIRLDNELHMLLNPDWFLAQSKKIQVGVIMHELDHVVHGHILRGDSMGIHPTHMNIAADIAINQHNPYLKDFDECLHLDKFNKDHKLNMIAKREMEYYARTLKDENIVQYKTFDDHSGWGKEGDEVGEEIANTIVKNALEKAVAESKSGSVPGKALETISKLGTSTIPWRRVLRQFVQRCQTVKYKNTRNRRNRRTGLTDPGKRQIYELKIACCVDTSGSVSVEMLEAFATELESLKSKSVEIKIIEYDYTVQKVYDLKKHNKWDFSGRGGTSHKAGLEEALKHKVDAVFVFTDGDPAEVQDKYALPVLWVITDDRNEKPAKFGKELRLKV